MLLKLLTLLGLGLMLLGAVRRLGGLVAPPQRPPGAADMRRCALCGAWHESETACTCRIPYTP